MNEKDKKKDKQKHLWRVSYRQKRRERGGEREKVKLGGVAVVKKKKIQGRVYSENK